MARPSTVHVCTACGNETPRWAGQCPGCNEWNTLVEEVRRPQRGQAAATGTQASGSAATPIRLGSVAATEHRRLSTGIGELDSVLGGGLVPGSLVLIGGSPGVGKSTLTTMALANLTAQGRRTLYVSAEESAAQIRLRAERLEGGSALDIPVIAETDLHTVLATLERERPEVCVIDSVQTLHSTELSSAAGSVAQVRGDARGQDEPHLRAAGWPCDQGGVARRAARARAPGRLRAAVRGRAGAHLPDGARGQEPLRLDQRGGRLRDA
jgi:DNA repair protein RadA/Sms